MRTEAASGDCIVATANVAAKALASTITRAGTRAFEGSLEVSSTLAPPAGAGSPNVTNPWDEMPPTTLAGVRVSAATVAAKGGGGYSKLRASLQAPAAPVESTPRTRHHRLPATGSFSLNRVSRVLASATSGAVKDRVEAIWIV
jgi:hypothetical protein